MAHAHDSLSGLIRFVRERSPFYRELYRDLPPDVAKLEALPRVSQADFWKANAYRGNRLLTGPIRDGILLRSGGSTGQPKFSAFSRDEWNEFTAVFAAKLASSGLEDGDRVANLFYAGEMYGSFLFTHKVLEECPVRVSQLPITGLAESEQALALILEYEATAIAALPTTLMSLVERMGAETRGKTQVRKVLFAGEPLRAEQRARLLEAFPGARIGSIGYASNDAGLLGYADAGCGPDEFRCYDGHAIYEILDEESGRPIREPGREGVAVVTALKRSLMPVLRYPVGDRAAWVEPAGTQDRKFRLLGRSEEAARVASISVGVDEVAALVGDSAFQLVVERRGGRDALTIRVESAAANDARSRELLEALYRAKPILKTFADDGKIHPPKVEWRPAGALETNPRTGKLRKIIDLRPRD